MSKRILAFSAFSVITVTIASAQEPAVAPALGYKDSYQVTMMSNLAVGDSVLNLTNAGFHSSSSASRGNICANVYVFSADAEMIACCACAIARNGLASYSARNDLIGNIGSPGVPTSIVVKVVSTIPPGGVDATPLGCDPTKLNVTSSTPFQRPTPNGLASGLRGTATHIHALPVTPGTPATTFAATETELQAAPLADAERLFLQGTCNTIMTNGGGVGICRSCRLGGL